MRALEPGRGQAAWDLGSPCARSQWPPWWRVKLHSRNAKGCMLSPWKCPSWLSRPWGDRSGGGGVSVGQTRLKSHPKPFPAPVSSALLGKLLVSQQNQDGNWRSLLQEDGVDGIPLFFPVWPKPEMLQSTYKTLKVEAAQSETPRAWGAVWWRVTGPRLSFLFAVGILGPKKPATQKCQQMQKKAQKKLLSLSTD